MHEYLKKTYWVPVAKRKILVTPIFFSTFIYMENDKKYFHNIERYQKIIKKKGGSELKVSFVVS